MSMDPRTMLSIDGLTVRFGGLTAVDDLSFKVGQGRIHALIGPNGAGKSTTFNCISRYYDPTGGAIALAGEDITRRGASDMAALGVARTFQNLELFNELSVEENVLLGTYAYGARGLSRLLRRPSAEHREFAHHLLERVGLADFLDAKANGLDVETYTYKLDEVDRAILDGEEDGFVRVHIQAGTGKLLGATIVATHAGEMIGEFSVAMKAGAGAKLIASTIHPYPTRAEANKKAVNLWRKAHFTPRTKAILTKLFAWMRR